MRPTPAKRARLEHQQSEGLGEETVRVELRAWRSVVLEEAQRQLLHARPVTSECGFTREEVIALLETIAYQVVSHICTTGDAKLAFVEHHSYQSIEYDVVSKCHRSTEAEDSNAASVISFRSLKTHKTFVIMLRVIEILHQFLLADKHATKRDIYYTDAPLFGNQHVVDRAIENIASMLQVPRMNLHVVGTEKSLIAGHLEWKERGDQIDCLRFPDTGKLIPGNTNRITELRVDAKFLLIVEDHATFMRLLNDGFIEKFAPCALLTGKGVPDVAARRLVRMMKDAQPSLVVLGLCDYDPWGIQIMCTYAFGSMRMAYDVDSLATPELLWLGVHGQDTSALDSACFVALSKKDRRKGELMLQMPALQAKPAWRNELVCMLQNGKKAELQALSSHTLSFLCDNLLPRKLAAAEWI